MASPLTISLKVVGLEQAKADLRDFGSIGQRSFGDIQAEAQKITSSMATTDRAMSGLANRMRRLAGEIDPFAAANINLRNILADLEKATQKDIISKEQQAQMTVYVQHQHEALTASLLATAEASLSAGVNIAALTAKYDPAAASAKRMVAELNELNQAKTLGVHIAGGYEAAWDGIIEKYDEAAVAAKRAAAAQAELIAQARAAQNATTAQSSFNTQLGVDQPRSSSARASAAVFEEVFAAEAEAERAAVALAATVTSLTAKFDPATTSARAMAAAIAELDQAVELGVTIAGGYEAALAGIITKYDEGAQAALKAAEALEKLKQEQLASNAAADAAQAQAGLNRSMGVDRKPGGSSAADSAAAFEAAFTSAQKYKDALSPIAALERQRGVEIARITELGKAGLLNDKERDASLKRTGAIYDEQAKLIQRNSGTSVASTAQVRFAVQQLGFQINDVATQLASGQSPLTIFIQQAAQFQQAFTAGGGVVNTMKAFGTSILNAINPITLLVAGVAAVGAGILFLGLRAAETEQRLRTFGVILDGMGKSSQSSAADLEAVAKMLQHTGTSAEEAQKAVQAFARTPNINPASATQLLPLARDISAVTGKDFLQVSQQIATAVAKDTDAVIKLVFALAGPNGLSEATAKAMLEMQKIGDRSGAAQLGLKALQDQFGGAFQKNLSDTAKTMNSIGEAWDNMLTKLSKTVVVSVAKQAIIDFLNGISNALTKAPTTRSPADVAVDEARATKRMYGGTSKTGVLDLTPEEEREIRSRYTVRTGEGGAIGPGSALNRANVYSKDIAGLNAELQNRLNQYFRDFPDKYIDSAAREGRHPSSFNPSGIGLHNKDVLGYGVAADVGGLYGYDPNLAKYGLRQNVTDDWKHVEPIEIPSIRDASGAARMEAARRFNSIYGTGALSGPGSTTTAPGTAMVSGMFPPAKPAGELTPGIPTKEELHALDEELKKKGLLSDAARRVGADKVYYDAYNASISGLQDTEANRYMAMAAGNSALDLWRIGLQKASDATEIASKGSMAYGAAIAGPGGAVAAINAQVTAQAELDVRNGLASDVETRKAEILRTSAAEAVKAAGDAVDSKRQETKASEMSAEGAAKSAAAEHEAGLQIQINQAAYKMLTAAKAAGIPITDKTIAAINKEAEALIRQNDAAQQNLAIRQRMNQRTDQRQIVEQQTQMVGQLPENIEAANARLQEQQKLLAQNKTSSDAIWQASMANVDALNKANIAHAEALRQQSRIDDMYRQIGSTIETALGSVLDGIFDPKKAIDWGTQVKTMLKSLVTGIASNMFIKPLTGTLLSTLGASPTVTSSFGGFGGIGGGLSGGLFKELGIDTGSTGGGLFSGTSSFMNKSVGGLFGTVQTEGWLPGANGIWTNATTGATTDIAGISNITPGLLGETTMGTAIGSVGLGFTAGTMLNSLVGGKSTGGMIGSGVGSLAGMALGSMVGMPWLGALLGGAGGGLLGGMFGNSKPSNASSGANIDLSNFKITSGFSGGNSQIDQQVATMGQSIQGFLDLLKTTGGALSGNVLLQSGVNTGITVDSSLAGYEGRFSLGKDTEAATKIIEQALIKSITGVSDTMKTVLSQVGTDEDIAKAIQFAKTYEELDKAAEDAFSSVEDASKKMGPFRIAMDQINAIFADLTTQATRFGLALEPINAGLEEATKRLQGDFNDAIDSALNTASGQSFINDLSTTIDDYLASTVEAAAIGLGEDKAVGDKLGQLFMDQVGLILKDLDADELAAVIKEFGAIATSQAQLVAQMGQTALNELNSATKDTTEAVQRLTAALSNLQDYIDNLTATAGFAVSPETALTEAQAQYSTQIGLAKGGDLTAIEGITTVADRLLQAIEGYYGSSSAGTQLFDQVVADLRGLTGTTTAHVTDPSTGLIVDTVTTQTNAINQTLTGQTSAINANADILIAANNAAAAAAIAANNANAANLIATNTAAAEASIAMNNENVVALIADTAAQTGALLAADEATKTALIEANNTNTAAAIEANNTTSASLIENANIATAALIDANNAASALGIVSAQTTGQLLMEQTVASSEATLAATEASTAAMLEQQTAAAAASLEAVTAQTQAITEQAVAASAAQLTATVEGTTLLSEQAAAVAAAGLEAGTAATQALLESTAAASEATLAATTEATAALIASADEASTAAITVAQEGTAALLASAIETSAAGLAATEASTAAILEQANLASESGLAATVASTAALTAASDLASAAALAESQAATEALLAQAAADAEAALAATEQSTADLLEQANLASEAALAESQAATALLLEQADAASTAALAATEGSTQILFDQAVADSAARLAETLASTDTIKKQLEDSLAAQLVANEAATKLLTEGQDASTLALLESDGLTRDAIIGLGGGSVSVIETLATWGADLHTEIGAGAALIVASADTWGADLHTEIHAGADLDAKVQAEWGAAVVTAVGAGAGLVAGTTNAWGASIVSATNAAPSTIVSAIAIWGADLHTEIRASASLVAESAAAWSGAIYSQTSTWGNAIAQTVGAWGQAIYTQIGAWGAAEIDVFALWGNAIASTTAAWGKAIADNATWWSNALYNQIGYWGKAEVDTTAGWGTNVYNAVNAGAKLITDSANWWSNAVYGNITNWGKAAVDTMNTWNAYIYQRQWDMGNWITHDLGAWGRAIYDQIGNWTKLVVDTMNAWYPSMNAGPYNAANSVISTIAGWTNAQMVQDVAIQNNLLGTANFQANSTITAIYGIGNTIATYVANWTSSQMLNDTGLINSLIWNNSIFANNTISAIYGAANSIVYTQAVYSNAIISNEANYLSSVVYWTQGTYNMTAEAHRVAIDQSNRIIYILQGIYDGLVLAGQNWPF